MKKIYYLSSCDTCARIIKELKISPKNFKMQDIKTDKITPEQLDEMKQLSGSYESLFSRVALKFRAWGLNKKELTEKDYRKYILEEYTFLRRPVILIGKKIFIGNAPSNIEAVREELGR
ncbi:MAG: ArsC/Spx/MgsR family protein [Bacteroidota bacterium]